MILPQLGRLDNMRPAALDARTVYIHDDHRWVVPLIFHAQESGRLPVPCKLVCLDRHHDALPPDRERLRALRDARRAGLTGASVLNLCAEVLSPHDDDWIPAAMELGLLSDAVVLGGEGVFSRQALTDFTDHTGARHRIELTGHLGPELAAIGRFGNLLRRGQEELLWNIFDWMVAPDGRLGFRPGAPPLALSIDLDYFVIPWDTFRLPWPEEVYRGYFLTPSDQPALEGATARDILRQLIDRAGLVAVAREAGHCGGESKAAAVFADLNRLLLDGRLRLLPAE